MVSAQLKNISQNGNLPQVGMKIKNIKNHHLVFQVVQNSFSTWSLQKTTYLLFHPSSKGATNHGDSPSNFVLNHSGIERSLAKPCEAESNPGQAEVLSTKYTYATLQVILIPWISYESHNFMSFFRFSCGLLLRWFGGLRRTYTLKNMYIYIHVYIYIY